MPRWLIPESTRLRMPRRGAITPAGERRPTGGMRRRSPPQRNSRPLGSRLWSSAELGGGRFGRLLWRLGHLPPDPVAGALDRALGLLALPSHSIFLSPV